MRSVLPAAIVVSRHASRDRLRLLEVVLAVRIDNEPRRLVVDLEAGSASSESVHGSASRPPRSHGELEHRSLCLVYDSSNRFGTMLVIDSGVNGVQAGASRPNEYVSDPLEAVEGTQPAVAVLNAVQNLLCSLVMRPTVSPVSRGRVIPVGTDSASGWYCVRQQSG